MNLLNNINPSILKIFQQISSLSSELSIEVHVVGGFVRDTLLNVTNKDLDFVVVGDGIAFAKRVKKELNGEYIVTYNKFGTAKVGLNEFELEFVGARSEVYSPSSRKPVVEDADLKSDLSRRDFTINAMAINLSSSHFGSLIDLFNGQSDLASGLIKTPLEPNVTFKDDPLRIMRAVRFASRFKYIIEKDTYTGIVNNNHRLKIISYERITEELRKTFESEYRSYGLELLQETGVLKEVLPEISDETYFKSVQLLKSKDTKKWSFVRVFTLLLVIEKLNKSVITKVVKRFKLSNETLKKIIYLTQSEKDVHRLFYADLSSTMCKHILFSLGEFYQITVEFYSVQFSQPKNDMDEILLRLEEVDQNGMFSKFELEVNGEEIQRVLNIEMGVLIGRIKNQLTNLVLNEKISNDASKLITYLKDNYESVTQ